MLLYITLQDFIYKKFTIKVCVNYYLSHAKFILVIYKVVLQVFESERDEALTLIYL